MLRAIKFRGENFRNINDSGWIVGYGNNPAGERRAFLLTPVSSADFTLTLNVEPNDVGIDTITPAQGRRPAMYSFMPLMEIVK